MTITTTASGTDLKPGGRDSRADKATQRLRLVIARHGDTKWTVAGRYTGTTDVDLSAYGRLQAASLSSLLQCECCTASTRG